MNLKSAFNKCLATSPLTIAVWVFIALVIVYIYYLSIQTRLAFQAGIAWDAAEYWQMSQQIQTGVIPTTALKPFVFRIGTPYIIAKFFPSYMLTAYLVWNSVFVLAAAWLLYFFVVYLTQKYWLGLICAVLFVTHPNGFRFYLFYPVFTDAIAVFISLSILFLGAYKALNWKTISIICLLTMLGVVFREVVLVAPLALLCTAIYQKNYQQLSLSILPVLLGISILLWIQNSPNILAIGDYKFLEQAYFWFLQNLHNPYRYIAAIALNVGPIFLITLLLVYAKPQTNQRTLILLVFFCLGIATLAAIGGSHIDRFIFWASIAYLPLLALLVNASLAILSIRFLSMFLGIIGIMQMFAYRLFLPIPNQFDLSFTSKDEINGVFLNIYGKHIQAVDTVVAFMDKPLHFQLVFQYGMLSLIMLLLLAVYHFGFFKK